MQRTYILKVKCHGHEYRITVKTQVFLKLHGRSHIVSAIEAIHLINKAILKSHMHKSNFSVSCNIKKEYITFILLAIHCESKKLYPFYF